MYPALRPITLALTLATLPLAAAQAAEPNFVGASVGVRVNAMHDKVDYQGFLAGRSSSKNDTGLDILASYGFALSPEIVANVGVSYATVKAKFGTVNYVDNGNQHVTGRLKDHWSVFVEPGYRIDPQWLVYASLSYDGAKGEYDDTEVGRGSVHTDGFGYGLGVSYAITRQFEASVEAREIDFSRKSVGVSSGKPKITEAGIRLNYRF